MSQEHLPVGWDDETVQRVLAHYEGQTEVDALVEDEAGIGDTAKEIAAHAGRAALPRRKDGPC